MNELILNQLTNVRPLLILDMANNHNGSLEHGKRIIDNLYEIAKDSDFPIAIKFQYRNLPNFIHESFRDRRDIKYVDRFLSTKLEWNEFESLVEHIKKAGFLSACTPFDEFSVGKISEHNFDILKIASASFTDWSLLEEVSKWNGPIVASTAGATLSDIDRVVAFFENRKKNFALMHCVAAYPTENKDLLINRLATMKSRYSNLPIGYSTHESPENMLAGPLALAAGGVILERHVGSNEDGSVLNKYSSDKKLLKMWLDQISSTVSMLGPVKTITSNNQSEREALNGLRRYAFANRDVKPGERINFKDVYYAIPGSPDQLQANDFGKYSHFMVSAPIAKDEPIMKVHAAYSGSEERVFQIRSQIMKMIVSGGITIPNNSILEISHHYGLDSFDKFGTCMITVVNREYCKKILFLLPGQTHPAMFHKVKDETFFLLYGDLSLKLDNVDTPISVGDTVAIAPGVIHEFSTKTGAIIEEVSSSHSSNDSFYVDDSIAQNKERKTFLHYWLELE